MILHAYAFDSGGHLTAIDAFTRETKPSGYVFRCVGCGGAMNARIGEENQAHFAHQDQHRLCKEEAYLTGLAIESAIVGFAEARAHGHPFPITLPIPGICHRPVALGLRPCTYTVPNSIDLARGYEHCERHSDGDSRLSVTRADGKSPLQVLVWVTKEHRREPPATGKWIEIRVTNEAEVATLAHGFNATAKGSRFDGLDLARYAPGDCPELTAAQRFNGIDHCPGRKRVRIFTVDQDGRVDRKDCGMRSALRIDWSTMVDGGLWAEEATDEAPTTWMSRVLPTMLDQCPSIRDCRVCEHRTIMKSDLACTKRHRIHRPDDAIECHDFERHKTGSDLAAKQAVLIAADEARGKPGPVPVILAALPTKMITEEEHLAAIAKLKADGTWTPRDDMRLPGLTFDETLDFSENMSMEQITAERPIIREKLAMILGWVGEPFDGLPPELSDAYEKGRNIGRVDGFSYPPRQSHGS